METNTSGYWDKKYEKEEYAWGLGPSDVAARVGELLQPGKRALDVGCGCGRDALFFATRGAHAVGVDWSEEGIEQARRLKDRPEITGSLDFVAADLRRLLERLEPESFDLLCSYNVFHLLRHEERSRVFADLVRLIRPGGLLAFEVFSKGEKGFGEGEEIEPGSFIKKNQVVHFYDDQEIKELTSGLVAQTLLHVECPEDYPKPHVHQEWLYVGERPGSSSGGKQA